MDKRISRVIRRLGLIDSRCTEDDFLRNTALHMDADSFAEWLDILPSASLQDHYNFQYSTVERAIATSVSWRSWPLEVEMRWLLPRLQAALERAPENRRYLVEIGAGPGAASAVASAVLRVPVIATDAHPATLGLAEELARMTQGDVKSMVLDVANVNQAFIEEPPTAIFGLGIFRYVVEHNHRPNVFSFVNSTTGFMKQDASSKAMEFFESISPAELLLSEQMCEDYLGEIGSAGSSAGYFFAKDGVELLQHHLPDGPSSSVCVHLTTDSEMEMGKHPIEQLAGDLPPLHAGIAIKGVQAEVLRAQLSPVEQLEIEEFTWRNGSGTLRREFFRYGEWFGSYRATNVGLRELKLVDLLNETRLREETHQEEEEMAIQSQIDRRVLATPSSMW